MDHQVEARDLLECLRVVDAEHLGIVARPVQRSVAGDVLAVEEDVPEDAGAEDGDLRHQGDAVVEDGCPVVRLLHGACAVCLPEGAVGLKREQAHGELRHGVHVLGKSVDELHNVVRDCLAAVELRRQRLGLRIRWHLVREEKPKGRLRQANLASSCLRQLLVALLQRAPAVADALHGVQVGGLADHALDAAHTTDAHADRDVTQ
mmetsp:Transcript_17364/g.36256  ORF Transcript_17364/g.36256 Transcript_17364/m.36256 type:complete len:205 (+) Transcript_17364:507-1121(+)